MKKKALLVVLSAVMLVAASMLGTMAYLTDSESVANTFTVGRVGIELYESPVDENGAKVDGADPVKTNSYHLLPGHDYSKDPYIQVDAGSEDCYVRMFVTINKSTSWDAIFAKHGLELTEIFNFNSANWELKGNKEDTAANTRTYEFWRKTKVTDVPEKTDLNLEPLFTSINAPGELTNADLASVEGFTIGIEAHAIQAAGFDTAADAWANWN